MADTDADQPVWCGECGGETKHGACVDPSCYANRFSPAAEGLKFDVRAGTLLTVTDDGSLRVAKPDDIARALLMAEADAGGPQPWRDGDESAGHDPVPLRDCHCEHCRHCGRLYRLIDIAAHTEGCCVRRIRLLVAGVQHAR